jgi:hypothetical protein
MVIQAKGFSLSLSLSLSLCLSLLFPWQQRALPRLPNSTFSLEAHHHHLPPWLPVCFPVMYLRSSTDNVDI